MIQLVTPTFVTLVKDIASSACLLPSRKRQGIYLRKTKSDLSCGREGGREGGKGGLNQMRDTKYSRHGLGGGRRGSTLEAVGRSEGSYQEVGALEVLWRYSKNASRRGCVLGRVWVGA